MAPIIDLDEMNHASSPIPLPTQQGRRLWSMLGWIALLLACIYFVFRGPILPNGNRLWDWAVCAASSYLWVHGEDPFAWEAVKGSWLERGSAPGITPDVSWLYAIVPPTTLAVLAPFAALPVAIGAYLYLLVTTILTAISVWVSGKWADLRGATAWRLYVAAMLVSVPVTLGLYSGNPTMLAAPLLIIGSYLISTKRTVSAEVLGGALIGIGVACKLQIGVPVLLLWVALGRWRASLSAVLVALAIGGIAIGRLAMADIEWLAGWVENVQKMQTAGGLNDYVTAKNPDDLVNLQVAIYRLLDDRTMTDRLTMGIWILLSLGALVAIWRRHWVARSSELPIFGMVGLLLLMPVYHRTYDAIMLLPLAALIFAGLARRRDWWPGWLCLLLLASLLVPAGLPYYLSRRGIVPALDGEGVVSSLVFGHKGWCLLAVACVWIALILGRKTGESERAVQEKS